MRWRLLYLTTDTDTKMSAIYKKNLVAKLLGDNQVHKLNMSFTLLCGIRENNNFRGELC